MTSITRNYSELSQLSTIEERFEYLSLGGIVGESTFGFDRWINQQFYRSREWRLIRSEVITRDLGFDLGVEGVPIRGPHLVHHMNPITVADITEGTENLIRPEFLITVALRTHNGIHYGDASVLPKTWKPRTPNDHIGWKPLSR